MQLILTGFFVYKRRATKKTAKKTLFCLSYLRSVPNVNHEWQDCDYVLNHFAKTEMAGLSSYRQFIFDGVSQGNRPELVGGGLVRSQGGWAEVKTLRRTGLNEASDERILGSDDFVETITLLLCMTGKKLLKFS